MLEKLAAIANFADQNGQYIVASDATKIIKEAQLWDALRTLFDPEHTPGVDRNTPFWKRLSKGWSRGRMDRHLGLVLAIMTERTKLNKKIDSLIAPIKEFQEQVSAFYEKLRTGNVSSGNLREESRGLQGALKDTLKLISGTELRQILKMKERLEAQQLQAAEKIKGLDDETKNNLMAVLRGESLPGSTPSSDEIPNTGEAQIDIMKRWLKSLKIPRLSYNAGATTKAGAHQFREFMELYGFHPKAITDRFSADVDAQAEGFARFPRAFSELLRRSQTILDYDTQRYNYEQNAKRVPGAATEAPPEPPMKEIKEEVIDEEESQPSPASPSTIITSPPPIPSSRVAPPVSPVEVAKSPLIPLLEKPPLAPTPIASRSRKKRDTELARELAEKEKEMRVSRPPHPGPTVPEEKVPQPIDPSHADDTFSLASSVATRTERQITRFGRIQQLRKLATGVETDPVNHSIMYDDRVFNGDDDPGPDVYEALHGIPSGLESFDETKHVDPESIEYYKGRREWGDKDDYDIRTDPDSTPEDDYDYQDRRPEPVLPTTKDEELEQLSHDLRSVQRNIDNFKYSRDNDIGDHYRSNDLATRRKALINRIKELSGLPESWIRTSSKHGRR